MKRIFLIVILSVLIVLIFSIAEAKTSIKDYKDAHKDKISLKSRVISQEAGATKSIQSVSFNNRHILLQLDHIPTNEENQEMARNGIKLLDYIPDKAWFAYISDAALSSYNITYIGDILPEDKISPYTRFAKLPEIVTITIVMFSDVNASDAKKILQRYGNVVSVYESTWKLKIISSVIRRLASEDAVKWIEFLPAKREISNDGSRAAESVDAVQVAPYNLNGTGIVVSEWDGGWADNSHADLAGRITLGDNGSCGGGDTGTCGVIQHATHVAGTVIGTGFNSSANSGTANQWRGMAPNATLISYEWWDSTSEMTTEYNASINTYNATISQNSWGLGPDSIDNATCNAVLGNYDSDTALVDNVTRGSLGKMISIVWAAGNQRATTSSYCGSIGFTYGTVSPYGTAKNAITVGAVTKTEAMSTFSSWGPTDDGRIKPDVVAAGVSITSTNNGAGSTYATLSGTSMATPAVSGIIALVQQDAKNYFNTTLFPSTVKALLIHTAKDLNETGPDYATGWGLVNATLAANKLREDNSSEVIIEDNLSNGQSKSYIITVSNQSALKITLAWDDSAGTPNAATELVNNLELVVYNTSGSRIFPWTLNSSNPSSAAVQNAADSVNNVEQVYASTPENGTWTFIVNGTSVPQAPQRFSLISSHTLSYAPDITQPIISPSPAYKSNNLNGSAIVTDLNNDNMSVHFRWHKNGVNIFNHTFAAVTNGTNATALLANGNFSKHDNITLEAWANDTTSNSTFRNASTLEISNSPPSVSLASPENYANASSRNITFSYSASDNDTDSITYYIFINGTLNMTAAATSKEINFTDGSYNWSVSAGDNEANTSSTARFFTVDTTGPNITINSPINRTYNDTLLLLNYTVADGVGISNCWYVNVTGVRENLTGCNNLSFVVPANQTSNITLYSNDTLNNTNSMQVFFSVDMEEPAIVVESPTPNNETLNNNWYIFINVTTSETSTVFLEWNGVNESMANATASRTSWYKNKTITAIGNYTFRIWANDSANNTNASETRWAYVNDTVNPSLNLSSPSGTAYTDASIALNYTAGDNIGLDRCWYKLNSGANTTLANCTNATITAQSGSNTLVLAANDTAGNRNETNLTFTYSPPSSPTTTVGGGGGGGGGEPLMTTKQANTLPKITPASPATVNVYVTDASVSKITIDVRETVNNVQLTTEKLDAKPDEAKKLSGEAFKYLNITANIYESSINTIKIRFYVDKGWMVNKSFAPSDIFLSRYAGESWNRLNTRSIGEGTNSYEFEAESPGFSIFAIAGEKAKEKKTDVVNITITEDTNASAINKSLTTTVIPSTGAVTVDTAKLQAEDYSLYVILAATAIMTVVFVRLRKKK